MSKECLWEIGNAIRAGYPLLYLVTWEEERAIADLVRISMTLDSSVYTWSLTTGLCEAGGRQVDRAPTTQDCLRAVSRLHERALIVLCDAHPDLRDRTVIRLLRDLARVLKDNGKTIIMLSSVLVLPLELEKDVRVIDYDPPDDLELASVVRTFMGGVARAAGVSMTEEEMQEFASAARGLTAGELENILAESLVDEGRISVNALIRQKEQIIRKTGLLEYYHSSTTMDDVGGLVALKSWLAQRGKSFSLQARQFGLPYPKGVLLLGVQGCGKSLCAKAVAQAWNLPLLRLDVGKVYSGFVGSSEENTHRVIQVCESVAPTVLWLDEIEKGFAGTPSSSYCDGGTTARVFGSFVTWLQEKTAPLFVVATANNISQLPPELLRKGRFDEIFFVDLPDREARREIWSIHLSRANRDPAGFDLDWLAEASEGMSGAEIEQAVFSALYDAFDAGDTDLSTEGLVGAIAIAVPLSRTMAEEIAALRVWARERARPAS